MMQSFALGQTHQHQRCDRRINEAIEADDSRWCDEEKDGDAERQASKPHCRPAPTEACRRSTVGYPAVGGRCRSPPIRASSLRAMLFNDLEIVFNVMRLR